MAGLFAVLLVISIMCLLWGLIAPKHISKTARIKKPVARKHIGLVFGCLIIVFFVLFAVTDPQQKPTATLNIAPAKNQTQASNVTTKQVIQTQPIAFTTTTQTSSTLAKGQTQVTQKGKNGVETLIYSVTYTNGKQTNKTLASQSVTTQPVSQIVTDGTYVAPAPAPTPTPAPAQTSTPASCTPLTAGGNCYEPGEYCSNAEHGTSGVAGDGESITCEDNNGWRWEPS